MIGSVMAAGAVFAQAQNDGTGNQQAGQAQDQQTQQTSYLRVANAVPDASAIEVTVGNETVQEGVGDETPDEMDEETPDETDGETPEDGLGDETPDDGVGDEAADGDVTQFGSVAAGEVSEYRNVSTGTHNVTVRLANGSDQSEPLYEGNVTIEPRNVTTLAFTGEFSTQADTDIEPVTLEDDAFAPADEEGAVRAIHVSPDLDESLDDSAFGAESSDGVDLVLQGPMQEEDSDGVGDETPEDGMTDETPEDDGMVDETPEDDGMADETPEDGMSDETPEDDGVGDATPGDDGTTDETPEDDGLGDETPGDDGAVDETPDDTIGQETPGDDTIGQETPDNETDGLGDGVGAETPADDGLGDETPEDDGLGDATPEDGTADETPEDDGVGDETPDDGMSDETPEEDGVGDETPEDGVGDETSDDVQAENETHVIAENVSFRNATDYMNVPAGEYTLEVRESGGDDDGNVVETFDVTVEGGSAQTVMLYGYEDTADSPSGAEFNASVVEDAAHTVHLPGEMEEDGVGDETPDNETDGVGDETPEDDGLGDETPEDGMADETPEDGLGDETPADDGLGDGVGEETPDNETDGLGDGIGDETPATPGDGMGDNQTTDNESDGGILDDIIGGDDGNETADNGTAAGTPGDGGAVGTDDAGAGAPVIAPAA